MWLLTFGLTVVVLWSLAYWGAGAAVWTAALAAGLGLLSAQPANGDQLLAMDKTRTEAQLQNQVNDDAEQERQRLRRRLKEDSLGDPDQDMEQDRDRDRDRLQEHEDVIQDRIQDRDKDRLHKDKTGG